MLTAISSDCQATAPAQPHEAAAHTHERGRDRRRERPYMKAEA